MNKPLLIFILLFSTMMFSSPSYGEWTKVTEGSGNNLGDTFYVDFERIRKDGGYVYWWDLNDFLKPGPGGILSAKVYSQGDCKLFRFKQLSIAFHKEPMGEGTGNPFKAKDRSWIFPSPNSVDELVLKTVCNH